MTDETQLRKQIQEEMDREAMVERRINNSIKRFFKMFKQYKLVNTVEQSDVILVFDKTDSEYFNVLLTDEKINHLLDNLQSNYVIFFIKNKNKHNTKLHVLSDIMTKKFYKQ